jgi:uncharacterized protein
MSEDLPVTVKGLVPTPTGCGVFLGHGEKVIAIFVDHNVAAAMTLSLHKIRNPRPLTHDLIGSILAGLGVTVQKVVVNDLKEDTFFARLFLLQENEQGRSMAEIDSRPSDAITLALQQGCPIYVRRAVWDRAEDMTWFLKQAGQQAREKPDAGEEPPESPPS